MSPKRTEDFEQARHASKKKLLDAALALFVHQGFEHTSIKMIARCAQVSQGLMYNYFDSKHDLLKTIFQLGMRDVLSSFEQADAGTSPVDRLERLIRSSFEIVRKHRDFWSLFYQLRHQPAVLQQLPEELDSWSLHIERQLTGYLQDLHHPQPQIAARILFATIDGIAQHWALEPEGYPLEEVTAQLIHNLKNPAVDSSVQRSPYDRLAGQE